MLDTPHGEATSPAVENVNPHQDIFEHLSKITEVVVREGNFTNLTLHEGDDDLARTIQVTHFSKSTPAVLVVNWHDSQFSHHASLLTSAPPDVYEVHQTRYVDSEDPYYQLSLLPPENLDYDYERLTEWTQDMASRNSDVMAILNEHSVDLNHLTDFHFIFPTEESMIAQSRETLPGTHEITDYPGYSIAGETNAGRERENNEDAFVIEVLPDGSIVLILADGMGGHSKGEAASYAAVIAARNSLRSMGSSPASATDAEREAVLFLAIADADKAVRKAAPQGGTTLTLALLSGFRYSIAHIGDSRAYEIDPSMPDLTQLTEDDVYTPEMIAAKYKIDIPTATYFLAQHPGLILKCLGKGSGSDCEPVIIHGHLNPQSALMLCSDGMYKNKGTDLGKIREIILNQESGGPSGVAHELVNYANELGGSDNITNILAIPKPSTY